ncbi:GerW family sporulation protein [Effusibacillus dendaii]|uniref:Putative spore protein YtfJ n=1 Tax=Effusibacillus dendaii TaxID=2743772 RepID=A0A7I8D6U6_9BACL|nr:GerW family sporulation protein [Effusibacillus dendaii]BCJ85795.1 putative spore protein YtfJ [Effusibacillus dendaii]
MADHPIQGLMQTAMENIKQMIDVNTIIGDAVETPDGSVILPISKVGFGFAAGGSEFEMDSQDSGLPFGGGAGGGVSITPVGFLVVAQGQVKLLSSEAPNQLYERIIDMAPQVFDRIQSMIGNKPNQMQQQQNMNQMPMHTQQPMPNMQ